FRPELGGLLDRPLEVIEFDERGAQRDARRRRRVRQRLDHAKGHALPASFLDLGQPRLLVVGDFEALSRFDPQYAREMACLIAVQLGRTAANRLYEKSPSRQTRL